jgi:hypothetical protein
MRKFAVFIVTILALVLAADVVPAGKINISGTHSRDEVKATCDKVGGGFGESANFYSCSKECGNTLCSVDCNKSDNKCTGSCPNCGRRERRLPTLGGADAVDRTLNNSVERPSKPY